VLVHNCKIIVAKATPETVRADRFPDTAPPVHRAYASASRLKILDEWDVFPKVVKRVAEPDEAQGEFDHSKWPTSIL
jgi:hypothetical protein